MCDDIKTGCFTVYVPPKQQDTHLKAARMWTYGMGTRDMISKNI
jgi:hypothetical protein